MPNLHWIRCQPHLAPHSNDWARLAALRIEHFQQPRHGTGWPLHAAFPLRHRRLVHPEQAREHRLAHPRRRPDATHLRAAVVGTRRQAQPVEVAHRRHVERPDPVQRRAERMGGGEDFVLGLAPR
jgi:hypothetical protein